MQGLKHEYELCEEDQSPKPLQPQKLLVTENTPRNLKRANSINKLLSNRAERVLRLDSNMGNKVMDTF